MAYLKLPTRTTNNTNNSGDINQLTENIEQLKGGTPGAAPSTSIEGLNSSKIDATEKGAAGGVATLDVNGLIPDTQIPPIALSEYMGAFDTIALALADPGVASSEKGDWLIVTNDGANTGNWIVLNTNPVLSSDLKQLYSPSVPVQSVNGQTGNVVLAIQKWWEFAADPTVNEDGSNGYSRGDWWLNTTNGKTYVCLDNATGSADWFRLQFNSDPVPAHASNHATGGSDPITPESIGAANGVTVLQNDDYIQLEPGMAVYLSAAGKVKRADVTNYDHANVIGIVKSAIPIGDSGEIVSSGIIDIADWSGALRGGNSTLAAGRIWYLAQDGFPGKIDDEYYDVPGQDYNSTRIGVTISPSKMAICIMGPTKLGYGSETVGEPGVELRPVVFHKGRFRRLTQGESLNLDQIRFTKPGTYPYVEQMGSFISRDEKPSLGNWIADGNTGVCFAINIESRGLWIQTFGSDTKWDKVSTDRSRKRHFFFMGA